MSCMRKKHRAMPHTFAAPVQRPPQRCRSIKPWRALQFAGSLLSGAGEGPTDRLYCTGKVCHG